LFICLLISYAQPFPKEREFVYNEIISFQFLTLNTLAPAGPIAKNSHWLFSLRALAPAGPIAKNSHWLFSLRALAPAGPIAKNSHWLFSLRALAPAGPIAKNSHWLFSLRSVPLWGLGGLRNRIVTVPSPRIATDDSFNRQPAAFKNSVLF